MRYNSIFLYLLALFFLYGCSSYKSYDMPVDNGLKQARINVTDGTQKIAVIFPNGNICNEISPAAVSSFSQNANLSADNASVSDSASEQVSSTVSPLEVSSERVECVRISLFHACGLVQSDRMHPEKIADLYLKLVRTCGNWNATTGPVVGSNNTGSQPLPAPSAIDTMQ